MGQVQIHFIYVYNKFWESNIRTKATILETRFYKNESWITKIPEMIFNYLLNNSMGITSGVIATVFLCIKLLGN